MKKLFLLNAMLFSIAFGFSQPLISYGKYTVNQAEFLRAYNKNKTTVTDKEKSSSGAPAPDLAISGRVIRLSHEHLARWKKTYYAIPDLRAELEVADAYYFQTPTADGKLFFLVSSWLKREHAKLVKQEKDEREERNRIY